MVPPAPCPTCQSPNYVGLNNGTLKNGLPVGGKAFNRFIQIILENTDYDTARNSSVFQSLAKQGILLSSYLALTHPSEPNYIASISGDFYGCADDNYYHVPPNISTIVDLLEAKKVSWATYQENMPTNASPLFNFTSPNYNTKNGSYIYYVRKHNPLVIHDAITSTASRRRRIRNFNDFAADATANALPQWIYFTPNMVNDGHDTTIDFTSHWLKYWLVPLLKNPKFNSGSGKNGTLIVLTFDENETYGAPNRVFTLLLGSAIPKSLRGTVDSTLYTHYSLLSTAEANWGLGNLGRGDTDLTLSNVFNFVAKATNVTNQPYPKHLPATNLTGIFPGPLNSAKWIPFVAPTLSHRFGKTFIRPGLNLNITSKTIGPPINISYADNPYGQPK